MNIHGGVIGWMLNQCSEGEINKSLSNKQTTNLHAVYGRK